MKHLAILALTFLVGCGGGGGGSSERSGDVPFFGGVWRGSAAMLQNGCDLPFFPVSISFTHTVNQVGDQVVLDVLGGGAFRGVVEEDNLGFIVTGTPTTTRDGSVVCSGAPGVLYTNFAENHADVGLAFVLTCIDGRNGARADCEVLYAGSGSRG